MFATTTIYLNSIKKSKILQSSDGSAHFERCSMSCKMLSAYWSCVKTLWVGFFLQMKGNRGKRQLQKCFATSPAHIYLDELHHQARQSPSCVVRYANGAAYNASCSSRYIFSRWQHKTLSCCRRLKQPKTLFREREGRRSEGRAAQRAVAMSRKQLAARLKQLCTGLLCGSLIRNTWLNFLRRRSQLPTVCYRRMKRERAAAKESSRRRNSIGREQSNWGENEEAGGADTIQKERKWKKDRERERGP